MIVRRVALVLAALMIGGSAVAIEQAVADAPTAFAAADVAPRDVLANTQNAVYTFTFYNQGDVPLQAIEFVRPSATFSIKANDCPASNPGCTPTVTTAPVAGGPAGGWQTILNAPGNVIFQGTTSEPILAPQQTAKFTVVADVGTAPTDQYGPWSVYASRTITPTYTFESVPPLMRTGSLAGNVRVLQMSSFVQPVAGCPSTTPPSCADDGTVTAGEPVSLLVTVTNVGSGSVTLSAADAAITQDTPGALAPSSNVVADVPTPPIGPGQSTVVTFSGLVLGAAGNNQRLRVKVGNQATPAIQAVVEVLSYVQTSVDFTPVTSPALGTKSLVCNYPPAYNTGLAPGTGAYPGGTVRCSMVTSKSGDPAALLSTGTTLTVDDGQGHTFTAPLEEASYIRPNPQSSRRLQFAPATVPAGFVDGSYPVSIHYRGTDWNGAPISTDKTSTEPFVVNTPPSITSAGTGQNPDHSVFVTVTFSEAITGTDDVRNWKILDSHGIEHPVVTIGHPNPSTWTLQLAATPTPFFHDGAVSLTYYAGSDQSNPTAGDPYHRGGDLHDSQMAPVPTSQLGVTNGLP